MSETAIARIRFGYGFGPGFSRVSRSRLLAELSEPDHVASRYPSIMVGEALALGHEVRLANRDRRQEIAGAEARHKAARQALGNASMEEVRTAFVRIVQADSAFRERLTWFWADHFTVVPRRNQMIRAAGMSFVDEAIRPHLGGSFAEMLKAVVQHPAMLVYLDQNLSVGPDSRSGVRRGRGLNENLARELLELHTMGVGSGYTQTDVREAAELLTGLSVHPERGFVFRPNAAQPGAETVLDESYGSNARASIGDIEDFLHDLAQRPETARHLSRKMAVHFLGPTPDDGLLDDMAAAYRETGGNLGRLNEVMMEHPATEKPPLQKVKSPFDLIASTLVAFGIGATDLNGLSKRDLRRFILRPLSQMGQPFMGAAGPDGWPEEPAHWITPQGLATRISWAVACAGRVGSQAGDPRLFLDETLGVLAGEKLRFAVSAAETDVEGLALVLSSAEFNRR